MRKRVVAALIVVVSVIGAGTQLLSGQARNVPTFKVDTTWPKLPNNWVVGTSSSIFVDQHDNVWMLHRPRSVPAGRQSAPAVLEYDSKGNFIQAWGGPGTGYDWPSNEHGIFVDDKDQVWICGSGAGDDMILKFTDKGKFLMQIGKQGSSAGNADTKNVNMPADMFVYPKTNELFVADGYGNRRLIVFDATTGVFKRMWGAYGNKPSSTGDRLPAARGAAPAAAAPIARGANAPNAGAAPAGGGRGAGGGGRTGGAPPMPDQATLQSADFELVHSVAVSHDDLVYVADRPNRRIQVFSLDGKFVAQMQINPQGPSAQSVAGISFSPDPEQRLMYVGDYGNSQIVTIDRKALKILNVWGTRGAAPGEFQGIHELNLDSQGNLYVAEVAPGNRFQRFVRSGTVASSN